jgi:hypothetical protein
MFFKDTERSCFVESTDTMEVGKKVTAMYMFKEVTHEIVEIKEKGTKILTKVYSSQENKDKDITLFTWIFDKSNNLYRKSESKQVLLRPF